MDTNKLTANLQTMRVENIASQFTNVQSVEQQLANQSEMS